MEGEEEERVKHKRYRRQEEGCKIEILTKKIGE